MVETIFRAILITMGLVIVLGVIGSIAIDYNLSLTGYSGTLQQFFSIVCYILPFKKLMPIFVLVIAFNVFKISISILKTLWQIFNLA